MFSLEATLLFYLYYIYSDEWGNNILLNIESDILNSLTYRL